MEKLSLSPPRLSMLVSFAAPLGTTLPVSLLGWPATPSPSSPSFLVGWPLARSHRGNPAASLRVDEVLLLCPQALQWPGLPPALLYRDECALCPHKADPAKTPASPPPALHFLYDSLPVPDLVRKHQFTLLHMVALLGPSNMRQQP